MDPVSHSEDLSSVAFIGDDMPRKCGIAIFTTDLCEAVARAAPGTSCSVVAMNDTPEGYDYPPRVAFQVTQDVLDEYRRAADFLNVNGFQAVSGQHEFGIYGGPAGAHLLALLREIRVPIVSTLHPVLTAPKPDERRVFEELIRLSDRLVVMSKKAVGILKDTWAVPEEKVVFIHHGVADVPFVDPNFYKDLFSIEGRRAILTFGLLGPSKGIENVIRAMPAVVKEHPDAVYMILGATHPALGREQGEEYRFFLQGLVKKLGIVDNVSFHNRFVTAEELQSFLGAADVCVTPYPNLAQITSGTLASYVASGKAVVSTPYWHAEELLADGRGILVPVGDTDAIAKALVHLFENEVERHAMRKRAYNYGREMIWPEVARRYVETFARVREERGRSPRKPVHAGAVPLAPIREVPKLNLGHVTRMTDGAGVLRHAKYTVPDRAGGYSPGDNALALVTATRGIHLRDRKARTVASLASVYLGFLDHALDPDTGRFRDGMNYRRDWTGGHGSEKTHGRALWGLGSTVAYATEAGRGSLASNLFVAALPAVRSFESPLAIALSVVGIQEYLRCFGGDAAARRAREELVTKLLARFEANAGSDWPWLEDAVGPESARIPQALLMSGQWMQRSDVIATGERALEFLVGAQTATENAGADTLAATHFSPVGDKGRYRKGGERSRFDQLPADVQAAMDACVEAWHVTRERKWLDAAKLCYEWFLGRNDLGISLYDHSSGGCRDGLQPDRANQNEGSRATLSWLLAVVSMEEVRSEAETAKAVSDEAPPSADEPA